jgi:rhomboid protease GluP
MMHITILLVVINVIVFFVLSFGGMTEDALYMLEHGAMYAPYVVEYGEYYRMFTCMFLHFGFSHLLNNMVTLLIYGKNLEPAIGKIKFLLIYFLSGLGGNLFSLLGESITDQHAVSAGASGAIFGLTGALLALTILSRKRVGQVNTREMIIMIALSLYIGFTSEGVDNLAHVGGLAFGFLITVLMVGIPKKSSQHQE